MSSATKNQSKCTEQKPSFDVEQSFIFEANWQKNTNTEYVLIDLFKSNRTNTPSLNSLEYGLRKMSNKAKSSILFNPKLAPGNYYFNISLRNNWPGLLYIDHAW